VIGKLRGVVDSAGDDWAVIDVGGVGYHVYCTARTLRRLDRSGGSVQLFVDTHVREDHIHLYGFAEEEERSWFRLLQTVQGVGARVALAVLSALSPADLMQAVAAEDKAAITRVPGVGARTASRVVLELKDKVGAVAPAATRPMAPDTVAGKGASVEAVSALVNLGYSRSEAFGAVAAASRNLGAEAGVEALIRGGLKELAQ